MSFDKDYPNRKDQRKGFTKSAQFDRSCRHGGNCSWCENRRTVARRRNAEASKVELQEALR